jgi:hypothetical protein
MRIMPSTAQEASADAVAWCSPHSPPGLACAIEPFETAWRDTPPTPIRDLHPTQMTVGYREVEDRRQRRHAATAIGESVFRTLIVPVVLGPGGRSYILDRHHELCALAADGVADAQVSVVDDLRSLEWLGFWRTLDRRGWCWPSDAEGQRQDYSYIPTTIDGLADDPYRSLARALRRAGGYAKQSVPFSDFLWADFLRSRVLRTLVHDEFEAALREARTLARNGGPTASPLLQAPRIDLRPTAPGLSIGSDASELAGTVSTEAAPDA